jgi:hypothetical protein
MHPTGRPFQNSFLSGTGGIVGHPRNTFLPGENDPTLHSAGKITRESQGVKGNGVQDVGSLPLTPSQPGYGDHTPH